MTEAQKRAELLTPKQAEMLRRVCDSAHGFIEGGNYIVGKSLIGASCLTRTFRRDATTWQAIPSGWSVTEFGREVARARSLLSGAS